MTKLRRLARAWTIAMLGALGAAAHADTLVIGQVAELSGQEVVAENIAGARLWLDAVNADPRSPHRFVLKQYDDARDPAKTVALTRRLVEQDGAVALFGYRSTPSLDALAPVLDSLGIALVAPFNGSEAVRHATGDAFFLRATYHDEARRLVDQLDAVGAREVAVVSQSDPFGDDGRDGYLAALKAHGLAPTLRLTYDRKTLDVRAVVAALVAQAPSAALLACTPRACADIIDGLRAHNPAMLIGVLSNAVNGEFVKAVAPHGRGVLMCQVMPYPWNDGTPLVREFNRLNAQAGGKVPVSYATLEGFAAAKLLTEAARRANPPTREGLLRALRGMQGLDLGGLFFNPGGGHFFTEVTTLDANGHILR